MNLYAIPPSRMCIICKKPMQPQQTRGLGIETNRCGQCGAYVYSKCSIHGSCTCYIELGAFARWLHLVAAQAYWQARPIRRSPVYQHRLHALQYFYGLGWKRYPRVIDIKNSFTMETKIPQKTMTIEFLTKCCPNALDKVEYAEDDKFKVSFFANSEDMAWRHAAISLSLKGDGIARVATSTCLPTTGWVERAEAYRRAVEFMYLSGLNDS